MGIIRDVSGTAFVVAEFRAQENREAAPLYRDPVVDLFLDEDSRRAAGLVVAGFPAASGLVRIRTKYLDDTLGRYLGAGCEQVLILGAGLDTRAVRKAAPGVTYFEIDEAATLALKRRTYEDRGIGARVRFIAGNYVTDGLIALLQRHGFDFDAPTYVIWEGNTMYLPVESIRRTLADLEQHVDRFRVSFDYLAGAVIAKTTGDLAITRLAESFSNMGAPWVSGIEDVQALAREVGLVLIEDARTAVLHRRYWADRPMASKIFEFYSLCTLGSPFRAALSA